MAKLAEILISFSFGIVLSIIVIELASSYLPLFQTDVRFVTEIQKKDEYLYAKFNPGMDVSYFSADLNKYNVRTNPLGIGDYNIRDDTPDEDVFGVAIGDSFTYCAEINVEDCWVYLLEGKVGREIVNLGGPGQFTITEERILSGYGLPLEPELVVWQFLTNDISETAYYTYNDTLPPLYDLRSFLNAKSNTYILFKRVVNSVISPGGAPVSFEIGGVRNNFNNIEVTKNIDAFCHSNVSKMVKDTILRAKEKTENSGADFLLVLVPIKEEIYLEELNMHLGSSHDFGCATDEIREFAENQNISHIDMRDHFENFVESGGRPYLAAGGHLSPEGNDLVANTIYDYLLGEKPELFARVSDS